MKQVMDFLLEQPVSVSADYNFLVEQGLDINNLDEDLVNNMLVVNAALNGKMQKTEMSKR